MPVTVIDPWTCPSCGRAVATPFCATCGEWPREPRDLTLAGLLGQAFEALTNVDGRLLRTLRCLVTAPGTLTLAFVEGRRQRYIGPVAIFLVANVIFFGAESLTHGLVFTTPLQSHRFDQPWSPLVEGMLDARLAALHLTLESFAPRFDAAIALHARSLILLMAIAFAPAPALVFRGSARPLAVHIVFALHLYAFLLLLFSIATAIPDAGVLVGGARSTSRLLDAMLSIALLAGCAVYLYRAIAVVYRVRSPARVLSAAVLTVVVATIVLGYRFALFLITLYTA